MAFDKIEDGSWIRRHIGAKLNGQALEAKPNQVEGQTITLTLTEEIKVRTNGGQAVEFNIRREDRPARTYLRMWRKTVYTDSDKASYDASSPL